MNREGNLIKRSIALLMVISLLVSDFLFVGSNLVSYAIDAVTTTNSNVEFMAYFMDESQNKVDSIQKNIDTGDVKLYVDVSVKKEGYFNGQITINNSSLDLKQETSSEHISEISGNTVTLNQINAGSTVTIELGILPKVSADILNSRTEVALTGSYVDSKNAKKSTSVEINGLSTVYIQWKSSDNTNAELESKVLTNSIYKVNGEEKRVLQLLINSKITDNNYPVKNTEITLNVPETATNVTVHARSTEGTNGRLAFGGENYTYNKQSNTLTISIANDDANVFWSKNVQDTFIVTMEFEKTENILNREIIVNSNIKTYDNKELSSTQNVHIENQIDGAATVVTKTAEDAIYKGKLYTGEERDYNLKTSINVDYLNDEQTLNINISEPKYVTTNGEISSNINYKETKLNKQEFIKLFGEEGNVTIKGNNQIIANINKTTEADENGIITVKYNGNIKNIEIETSKPISIGTLNLESTKTIKNTEYSKETVDTFTAIKETASVNDNKFEDTIELKNIDTTLSLKMNNTSKISTIADGQNIELEAILEAADESKALYKNPKLTLTLPEEIKISSSNVDVLNLNGLTLDKEKTKIIEDNKLTIVFNGEQVSYDGTEGTVIKITLGIKTDKLTPSKEASIKMTYSNEKTYVEKEELLDIELESQYGLMIYNKFSNYNNAKETIETVSSEETYGSIDVGSDEKPFAYRTAIINNYPESIQNVVIIGTIPAVNGEDTYKAELYSIEVNNPNARVTYSTNPNANATDNSWGEFSKEAVSYKIEIPEMQQGEVVKLKATVILPERIGYNKTGAFRTNVTALFQGIEQNNTSSVVLTTKANLIETPQEVTENKEETKLISTVTMTGNNTLTENDNIYGGQTLRYKVKVTNNTGSDYSNVTIKANQKNGYVWDYVEKDVYNPHYKTNSKKMYYEVTTSNDIELGKIDTFKNGETYTFEYEAVAYTLNNKDLDGTETFGTIYIASEDRKLDKTETTIKNRIKDEELQIKLYHGYDKEMKLTSGGDIKTLLEVKNTSNEALKDIKVKVAFSNNLIGSISLNEENSQNVSILGQEDTTNGIRVITLKIANIEANGTINVDLYSYTNNAMKAEDKVWILAKATTANNNEYLSNKFTRTVYNNTHNIELTQQGLYENGKEINTKTTKLNDGDKIKLIATITNKEEHDVSVNIEYNIDEMLNIENAKIIGSSGEQDITDNISFNNLKQDEQVMKSGETLQIEMTGTVDALEIEALSNTINVYDNLNGKTVNNDLILSVNTLHEEVLKPEVDEEETGDSPESTPGTNSTEGEAGTGDGTETSTSSQDENKKTYSVSGTAWVDKDKDGKKSSSEEKLKDITVEVVSLTKGKVLASTKTDASGNYNFTLEEGKYVLLFNYNNELYTTTTYKASGANESENSDAIERNVKFNGTTKKAGITDTITLNSNITNLDIGLVMRSTFDLKVQKNVGKITVTNKAGTKTFEQPDNTTLAKAEIKAKNLDGSLVVIEYKIKVTNIGDVAGYAKQIVDYMPSGLSFNSSLNKDWYLSGENLYNSSLANTKIEPGETKELTLVLTKTMTEANTGLINNKAEIKETSNLLGLSDEKKDVGSADVIISVSTGTVVSYIISTITTFILIAGVAYMINKKYLSRRI